MAGEFDMLESVKAALGITGDYLDNTINSYIAEVGEYLGSAGVPREVIASQAAAGVTARGVADLWTYAGGAGELSPYFHERAIQLATGEDENNGA